MHTISSHFLQDFNTEGTVSGNTMLETFFTEQTHCIARRRSISSTVKPILLGLRLTYKYWVW